MAYTDRAFIACSSVSVLVITLLTIYYWRSKRSTPPQPSPSPPPRNSDIKLNEFQSPDELDSSTNNQTTTTIDDDSGDCKVKFPNLISNSLNEKIHLKEELINLEQSNLMVQTSDQTSKQIDSIEDSTNISLIVDDDGDSQIATDSFIENTESFKESFDLTKEDEVDSSVPLSQSPPPPKEPELPIVQEDEMQLKNMSQNFSSENNTDDKPTIVGDDPSKNNNNEKKDAVTANNINLQCNNQQTNQNNKLESNKNSNDEEQKSIDKKKIKIVEKASTEKVMKNEILSDDQTKEEEMTKKNKNSTTMANMINKKSFAEIIQESSSNKMPNNYHSGENVASSPVINKVDDNVVENKKNGSNINKIGTQTFSKECNNHNRSVSNQCEISPTSSSNKTNNHHNHKKPTTMATNTSSNVVMENVAYKIKKEEKAPATAIQTSTTTNKQTFAQILLNNCDSTNSSSNSNSLMKKSVGGNGSNKTSNSSSTSNSPKSNVMQKGTQQSPVAMDSPPSKICSTDNNSSDQHNHYQLSPLSLDGRREAGNDSNLNSSSSSNNLNKDNNENEVDIYHNYPDLTTTPTSEHTEPNVADSSNDDHRSQGSNDSGQGSCNNEQMQTLMIDAASNVDPTSAVSTVDPYMTATGSTAASPFFNYLNVSPENQAIQYNFEVPIDLCGYLIGKKGRFINPLKSSTQTNICIINYTETTNLCQIYGYKENVMVALNAIKNRFDVNPCCSGHNITYNHIELTPTIALSQSCQLHLPSGIWTEVILSCAIDAGHFFLQQPTHPTYTMLAQLDQLMKENYSQTNAPMMPALHPGLVCAAPSSNGGWYRASVKYVHENQKECDLIFVDYGGHSLNVPVNSLRQIHCNFMSLPFQATECYLAKVQPANVEIGWTAEANDYFRQLAQGRLIYAYIETYTENGFPCVNLYKNQDETNSRINISEELVNSGHAQWIS